MKSLKSLFIINNHIMNYITDTDPGSSGSAISSENTKAIKEIQEKLNEILPLYMIRLT